MADSEGAPGPDPIKNAAEQYRNASKWVLASLGAVGLALAAGLQLSSIGALDIGSDRFIAAVVGLALALGGIGLATWQVSGLLVARETSLDELIDGWTRAKPQTWKQLGRLRRRWLQHRYFLVAYFERNPERLFGEQSPAALKQRWDNASTPSATAPIAEAISSVVADASLEKLKRAYRRARYFVAFALVSAAVGVCVFAWAANPGEQKPADLRNAVLVGADLAGSDLRGADLTGADLTNAKLRGAQLDGATIADVVWSNTECPDGTNSDDLAHGDAKKGTCAGHLSP